MKLKAFVASENPVKINAVKLALSRHFPQCQVLGLATDSGVAAQPMSDQETYQGAINRVKKLKELILSPAGRTKFKIGKTDRLLFAAAEGGVYYPAFLEKKQLWSTVWVAVSDQRRPIFTASGARFPLPTKISQGILSGQELADVLGEMLADPQIRSKQGAIGVMTKDFVNRTGEYAAIAELAIGLWYGREVQQQFS